MRRDPKHENGPGFMIAVVEDDPAKGSTESKQMIAAAFVKATPAATFYAGSSPPGVSQ